MHWYIPLQFVINLFAALALGAVVGLERQWRHCMAGTRTNALVAGGAAAFVMAGMLCANDLTANSRIAANIVTGVGFLGAGVIFKDSSSIHGLTTAATIWCSAATGTLAGLGFLGFATLFAVSILITNVALRPLANLINKAQIAQEAAHQARLQRDCLTPIP